MKTIVTIHAILTLCIVTSVNFNRERMSSIISKSSETLVKRDLASKISKIHSKNVSRKPAVVASNF